jgi:uncharacterized radical SAM superfamily Fe-S cluster-containing enzyme
MERARLSVSQSLIGARARPQRRLFAGVGELLRRVQPSGLQTVHRYFTNAALAALSDERALKPFVATYHVTSYCNLECRYCEDFGLSRNLGMKNAMLDLDRARHVLRVLRTATENLVLTGGETLLHPKIEDIVATARELGFRQIALITNGLLLPKRRAILPHLSRLIVSLDSLDRNAWDEILGRRSGMADRIIDIIEQHGRLQEEYGG